MMKLTKLKLVSFLFIAVLLAGCSSRSQAADDEQDKDLFVEFKELYYPKHIETLAMGDMAEYRYRGERAKGRRAGWRISRSYDAGSANSRRQLLRAARSAIGTPYVLGGTSPGGFDCSGLVCWAYGNVGIKLPRTAREQSVVGTKIRNVEDMQAGDIVAFRHPKRGYHTGIYVGEGKFIHSPRRKSHVKINSLDDPYFSSTFLSARRINLNGRENLLAQAESRLSEEYSYTPSRRRLKLEESRFSRNASRERSSLKRRSMAEYHARRHANRELRHGRDGRSKREMRLAERRKNRDKDGLRREKRGRSRITADNSRSRSKSQARSERSQKKKQHAAYESHRSSDKRARGDSRRSGSRTRKS